MLIVGLGNPGAKYEGTLHNTGFAAVDALADKLGLKFKKKGCEAIYAETYARGQKLVVAKPQTYMNLSGESVKQLLGAFAMTADDLIVVYDDIDLPFGMLRVRKEGSAGTHNGMRNIIAELGTQRFLRVRVGLGADFGGELRDYVLSRVPEKRKALYCALVGRAAECLADWAAGMDTDALMRRYNGAVQ